MLRDCDTRTQYKWGHTVVFPLVCTYKYHYVILTARWRTAVLSHRDPSFPRYVRGGSIAWTSLDFHFWGCIKVKVYKPPTLAAELEARIYAAVEKVTPDIVTAGLAGNRLQTGCLQDD